ncbi:hypothetical protein MPSEU_000012400 [Mayamaea pseudoterrestris]|nr:hypothetical protein MPSEU_000012400 [Mayamaea pseudoterrestris]
MSSSSPIDSSRLLASATSSQQKRLFSNLVTPSTSDEHLDDTSTALQSESKKPKALFPPDHSTPQLHSNHDSFVLDITSITSSSRCSPTFNADAAPFLTQDTQPCEYTQHSQTDEPSATTFFLVRADTHEHVVLPMIKDESITLGRSSDCHVQVHHQSVSKHHATLIYDPNIDAYLLVPSKPVYILQKDTGKWHVLDHDDWIGLGETFRLLPPCSAEQSDSTKSTQFTLGMHKTLGNQTLAGSGSFDEAYLDLLRRIQRCGEKQTNKKGDNWTLASQHTLEINLRSNEKSLLPMSTLRKIFFLPCLVEALWYIRGEDTIAFLVANGCKFWEKQAQPDGFIGLNYGLLTNFPGRGNQLEDCVIQPLCQGKSSRNMVCSLVSGEKTAQEACTTSIQFSRDGDCLNMTVHQRSSDVILGLPNDVVVWSIILHLVRREVKLRSGIQLHAGKLCFSISAGGAHVYCINKANLKELVKRSPIGNVQPCLSGPIGDAAMEQIAANYDQKTNNFDLKLLGYDRDAHHTLNQYFQGLTPTMDLLDGYSSSDDESKKTQTRKEAERKSTADEAVVPTKGAVNASPSNLPATAVTNKKGKKLISLAAVLPRHIIDQLTQSQVKGNDDDDDDDSDDEAGRPLARHDSKQDLSSSTSMRQPHVQRDPELSSLLSELNAAPKNKYMAAPSSKQKSDRDATKNNQSESLGAAFMTATTTVERKSLKESGEQAVYSVHDEAAAKVGNDTGSDSLPVDTDEAPPMDGPPSPAPQTMNAAAGVRSFRPAAVMRVSAAPRAAMQVDPDPPTGGSSNVSSYHEYAQSDYNDDDDDAATDNGNDAFHSSNDNNNPRKRSRKELERALRHGHLDAVETDLSLQANDPSEYHPSAASLSAAPPSQLGIHVAPTQMYDPSAGAVTAGQSRGRGKNQINHVMAAAAQLEEHRRQQYQREGASGAAKSYRANAKQKYGW